MSNRNLTHWFNQEVEPHLARYINRVTFFEMSLASAKLISYPLGSQALAYCLTDQAKTEAFSQELLREYSDCEDYLGHRYSPEELEDIELLYTSAYILSSINNFRASSPISSPYCEVCYRAKAEGLKYCAEHSATFSNNQSYRTAKKVYNLLSGSLKTEWNKHVALRQVVGETPEVHGRSIASSYYLGMGPFILDDDAAKKAKKHQLNPDSSVPDILNLLTSLRYLQHILKPLQKREPSAWTWDELCIEIFSLMNNKREATRSPFWVTRILLMANHWHFTEELVNQKVKPQDINIANDFLGEMSITKLANKYQVSRQTIYNSLKRSRVAGLPV